MIRLRAGHARPLQSGGGLGWWYRQGARAGYMPPLRVGRLVSDGVGYAGGTNPSPTGLRERDVMTSLRAGHVRPLRGGGWLGWWYRQGAWAACMPPLRGGGGLGWRYGRGVRVDFLIICNSKGRGFPLPSAYYICIVLSLIFYGTCGHPLRRWVRRSDTCPTFSGYRHRRWRG